jgi:dihydrofolate reductase
VEVIYYVAASADGYIATRDGGIGWLRAFETPGEDYGYTAFYASVDVLFMGSRTYRQCLGFGRWPYADKPAWVFSTRALDGLPPGVSVTAHSPAELVRSLESRWLRRAWLVGGGALAGDFVAAGLVTEYIISVMPVLLGDGIPLLGGARVEEALELGDARRFANGVMQLRYRPG